MTATEDLDVMLIPSPGLGRGKEMMSDESRDRIAGSDVIAKHHEMRIAAGD